ncbi:MAG TPA: tRNA (adenosine(37)-N6)-threonylcarbamoyltransferase complex dimerization subunit type 1 TsaB [Acidimicrobiales bacterium]|jgi:tRNA threonylcarbamoyladenosine biosynthesis protein TsaB
MNIVGIETATETVGVAVRTTDGLAAELALTGKRRHVESLTPALEHLLAQVGLEPRQIEVIAVDLGPGLFTGLRVGVAAAKGLAQALGVGVIGLTSLEVLAHGAAASGLRGQVAAVVDARRGEVFAALATVAPSGQVGPLSEPQLLSPDDLGATLAALGAPVVAVGDGAARYADVLASVPALTVAGPALTWPPPATLVQLALDRMAAGEAPVAPGFVVPLYMREADARRNFATATRS